MPNFIRISYFQTPLLGVFERRLLPVVTKRDSTMECYAPLGYSPLKVVSSHRYKVIIILFCYFNLIFFVIAVKGNNSYQHFFKLGNLLRLTKVTSYDDLV